MKYLIQYLIVFLFTLIAGKSYSQFHFGVKGGIGFNNANDSEKTFDNKNLTSLHFGIFTKIKLADKIHLIPELQYITKGYSVNENVRNVMAEYKVKISYVELPVLINYQIVKWVSAEAGPSLGIKVNARSVSGNNKSNVIDDFVEPTDFGVIGGIRFQPIEKLSVLARYNYGLSAVEVYHFNYGPNPGQSGTQKTHNKSIQISIAYTLK